MKALKGTYIGFEAKDADSWIRSEFERKHGYQPLEINPHGPTKLAGPLKPGDVVQVGERAQTGGEA